MRPETASIRPSRKLIRWFGESEPLSFCAQRCEDLSMSAAELIGRDAEITSLYDFFDRATYGQAAFVLEGEPGIGKSTLVQAGVEHGRLLGCGVLSARPTEAEHDLAHAALGDLFEDKLDDVLDRLSAPRRRAFEGALLLG